MLVAVGGRLWLLVGSPLGQKSPAQQTEQKRTEAPTKRNVYPQMTAETTDTVVLAAQAVSSTEIVKAMLMETKKAIKINK